MNVVLDALEILILAEKNQKDSFYHLDPEMVLKSTESAGFSPTGEFTQLNSYENRVFDIRQDDGARIIAKFYRPGRWSKEAILEEHTFLADLEKEGLTVASPIKQKNGATLSLQSGLWTAFFPKVQGRLPQEFFENDLEQIGKRLALLHNVGSRKKFLHRPILAEHPSDPWETLDFLLPFISLETRTRYEKVAHQLFHILLETIDPRSFQRIHGDCHRGNLLHNGKSGAESEFFFIDFDDAMMAPAVQDIWMLFSSADSWQEEEALIKGYESLREFPREQLDWIPALRAFRIFNYAAWIARRWNDPSFPKIFPQFTQYNYWAEEVEALEKIVWSLT